MESATDKWQMPYGAAVVNGLAADALALAAVAVTAGTTQTLAGATPLKTSVSVVNAATANDGVALPAATGSGAIRLVITVGSTATPKIWPQVGDKIDAAATSAAVTLTAANRSAIFVDVAAGQWRSFLLGAVAS